MDGCTPYYVPPEAQHPDAKADYSWDIWACGIILYAMLTANFPFPAEGPKPPTNGKKIKFYKKSLGKGMGLDVFIFLFLSYPDPI